LAKISIKKTQGVCYTLWPLPFTLKSYLKARKRIYGNSNISPCKNIIFKNILALVGMANLKIKLKFKKTKVIKV